MAIENWIEDWARIYPDKCAIQYEGVKTSYGEFDREIKNTAAMLHHSLGITRGDRVAYLGQNHPRMLYLLFACLRVGAIFLPLNWRLTPTEHHHMLENSGTTALFVEPPYDEQCEALREKLPHCQFITMGGAKKLGWRGLRHALGAAVGQKYSTPSHADDPAVIIYTSGTTGYPKGAVLSHRALEVNAKNSVNMHDMIFDDVILTILPMFHVGGLNIQTTAAFYTGATVLLHRTFDVEDTIAAINDDHPTLSILLPAHMEPLKKNEKFAQCDFSTFRNMTTGSCVVPDDMTAFWHDRNIPLLQVYGSSETCPIAIHQTAKDAFETAGSIGFPAKYCQARIIDETGADCPVGQAGEILIKGQSIMSSYWQNVDATDKALKGGWYHTGDMGYQDKDGCYHFVDRKNDMIISGGENIYPAELETVLGHHPKILEASVVGKPHDRWGEIAVAFIVCKDGASLGSQEILAWLNSRLGRYKHPREFHFIDKMPRNEMRKILKEKLRAMA